MNKKDLLKLVVDKVDEIQSNLTKDYQSGKISSAEKDKASFYVDQVKYEVVRILNSITFPR